MRNVFLFMMVTTDGYFEGPGHDISWHNVDNEFVDFAVAQLDEADTLVFGRRTYELMADFWPSESARREDPATAERMNGYSKIVFSTTLKTAGWQNTELHDGNPGEAIARLKRQSGKSIAVLGSSNLCLSLLEAHAIDEIRLMINPIAIGHGTSLFAGLKTPVKLSLENARQFKSGNELLTYRVDK